MLSSVCKIIPHSLTGFLKFNSEPQDLKLIDVVGSANVECCLF